VTIDAVFAVPFAAMLPSTATSDAGPGWKLYGSSAGLVTFQYVRDADRTPAYVEVIAVADVYRDPCHPEDGMATSGAPTIDEIVDALTTQVGVRATPVADISFGDRAGKTLELDNSIVTTDCRDDPWLRPWTYRSDLLDPDVVTDGEDLPNSHQRVAVVDVDGTPLLVRGWELGANRDEVLEMNELFESIRFE
jgi:hypothetical protein